MNILIFTAPFCVPCKKMKEDFEPMVEELKSFGFTDYINIEEDFALAQEYHVRAAPTIVLIKDGAEVQRMVGTTTYTALKAAIMNHIGDSE